MKSRLRSFQVEVRRAKGYSGIQKNSSKVVHRHRLPSLLSDGDWPEGLDPVTVPAVAIHATISGSRSPDFVEVPQVRRVLPDLRPSIIAQGEERVSTARPAKHSKRKADGSPYAAMRALDQDQDRITSEPLGTDRPGRSERSGERQLWHECASKGRDRFSLRRRPLCQPRCSLRRRSGSAAAEKPATRLPRWERWKERRLPRICWAKSSQSAR